MTYRSALSKLSLCLLLTSVTISCTTVTAVVPKLAARVIPPPPAKIVKIPILVEGHTKTVIPKNSRIVIADITGDCALEVKDALLRRLIGHDDFTILNRENLDQIIGEAKRTWAGKFNTTTAAKLGKLVGASLWIVGRVAYCGNTFTDNGLGDSQSLFSVLATLQIVDINTGEVLLSSASEGSYVPRSFAALALTGKARPVSTPKISEQSTAATSQPNSPEGLSSNDKSEEATNTGRAPSFYSKFKSKLKKASERSQDPLALALVDQTGLNADTSRSKLNKLNQLLNPPEVVEKQSTDKPNNSSNKSSQAVQRKARQYVTLKAAEDVANGFADKLFSRPTWETVEMWDNFEWKFGKATRLVKLGHYPEAVLIFKEKGKEELTYMNDKDTAQYLHNYGVALLCVNQLDLAVKKLRAAYRIHTNVSTLKMLGLTGKIAEWSLDLPTEEQEEVERLIDLASR